MGDSNHQSLLWKIGVGAIVLVCVWYWLSQSNPTPSQVPTQPDSGGITIPAQQAAADGPTAARPASVPAAGPPTVTPAAAGPTIGQTAKFDFYVLVLSWSPDFCADTGNRDQVQCAIGGKLGFVLHGLWPQYNQGYPENCSIVPLTPEIKSKYPGLFPSTTLMEHEWEKHGTCTGLTPDQYLAFAKRLKDSVNIPVAYRAPAQQFRTTADQMKKDYIASNPQFTPTSFDPYCSDSGRYLQEMYFCYGTDGNVTTCSNGILRNGSRSCSGSNIIVRNVR